MTGNDSTAFEAAVLYASLVHTNIGNHYNGAMQKRLRAAYLDGYHGAPRPVRHSNFDKPLRRAYDRGRDAALALVEG